MVTKDRTQAIQALFEASNQAFDAGDNKLGSLQLWQAAESALSIVAESRRLPCRTEDDHFDLIDLLDNENGNVTEPDLISGYLVAEYYRNNADYDFMEDYVIRGGIPLMRHFVDRLLVIAEQATE